MKIKSQPPAQGRKRSDAQFRLFAAYIAIVCLLSLAVFARPPAKGDVAVIVAPWSPASRAAAVAVAAGGDLISTGRWPFVVVARARISADQAPLRRNFITDLYRAGALLVLDPAVVAGCSRES